MSWLLGSPLAPLRALALPFLLLSFLSDSHATEVHTDVHLQLVARHWSAPKGTILGGLSALADSTDGVINWKLSYDNDAEAREPAPIDAQRCVRPPDPVHAAVRVALRSIGFSDHHVLQLPAQQRCIHWQREWYLITGLLTFLLILFLVMLLLSMDSIWVTGPELVKARAALAESTEAAADASATAGAKAALQMAERAAAAGRVATVERAAEAATEALTLTLTASRAAAAAANERAARGAVAMSADATTGAAADKHAAKAEEHAAQMERNTAIQIAALAKRTATPRERAAIAKCAADCERTATEAERRAIAARTAAVGIAATAERAAEATVRAATAATDEWEALQNGGFVSVPSATAAESAAAFESPAAFESAVAAWRAATFERAAAAAERLAIALRAAERAATAAMRATDVPETVPAMMLAGSALNKLPEVRLSDSDFDQIWAWQRPDSGYKLDPLSVAFDARMLSQRGADVAQELAHGILIEGNWLEQMRLVRMIALEQGISPKREFALPDSVFDTFWSVHRPDSGSLVDPFSSAYDARVMPDGHLELEVVEDEYRRCCRTRQGVWAQMADRAASADFRGGSVSSNDEDDACASRAMAAQAERAAAIEREAAERATAAATAECATAAATAAAERTERAAADADSDAAHEIAMAAAAWRAGIDADPVEINRIRAMSGDHVATFEFLARCHMDEADDRVFGSDDGVALACEQTPEAAAFAAAPVAVTECAVAADEPVAATGYVTPAGRAAAIRAAAVDTAAICERATPAGCAAAERAAAEHSARAAADECATAAQHAGAEREASDARAITALLASAPARLGFTPLPLPAVPAPRAFGLTDVAALLASLKAGGMGASQPVGLCRMPLPLPTAPAAHAFGCTELRAYHRPKRCHRGVRGGRRGALTPTAAHDYGCAGRSGLSAGHRRARPIYG